MRRFAACYRFTRPAKTPTPTPRWTGPVLIRAAVLESHRVIYGDCDQEKGSGYHAEKGDGE